MGSNKSVSRSVFNWTGSNHSRVEGINQNYTVLHPLYAVFRIFLIEKNMIFMNINTINRF